LEGVESEGVVEEYVERFIPTIRPEPANKVAQRERRVATRSNEEESEEGILAQNMVGENEDGVEVKN